MSEFEQLEQELGALRPAKPPAGFEARLEKALGEPGNVAVRHMPELDVQTEPVPTGNSGNVVPFVRSRVALFAAVAAVLAFAFYLTDPFSAAETSPSTEPIVANEATQPASPASDDEEDISPLHGVSAAAFAALAGEGWSAPAITETLLDATDEGVVERPGQAPARRYHYRYLDETTWKHP
ncbi:MAG: hypothetical protein VB997_04470, partial [Opitutales bacterium]